MAGELVERLRKVVAPPTEAAGYELVDVTWTHEAAGWILRLYIDGPGGVSHADCERVSRELSAILDVEDVIPHAYSLEVSSPGLNRPLRTFEHFARCAGDRARVRLRRGLEGRRNFAGRIVRVEAEAGNVVLEVEGREFHLPLDDVEKANRDHEFEFPKSR